MLRSLITLPQCSLVGGYTAQAAPGLFRMASRAVSL